MAHSDPLESARAALQTGRAGEARKLLRALLKAHPRDAEILYLIGTACLQSGDMAEACRHLTEAAKHAPRHAGVWTNLGLAEKSLGRMEKAEAAFRRALDLSPDHRDALMNLAGLLRESGRAQESADVFSRLLARQPNFAPALNGLGNALRALGEVQKSEDAYLRALALRPDYAEALTNFAQLLKETRRAAEAEKHLRRALEIKPDFEPAILALADLLHEESRWREAIQCLGDALKTNSARTGLRLVRAVAELPIFYASHQEIQDRRETFRAQLERLHDDMRGFSGEQLARMADDVGFMHPFYLAYQGENDRDLHRLHGAIVARAMAARYPELAKRPEPRRKRSGPLRVGFAGGHFYEHSVWKIPVMGFALCNDPERYQVYCYHTDAKRDLETERAEKHAARFVQGPKSFHEWCAIIRADQLDVLIFPEIGMNAMPARLAALRLAPVQATTWGHPSTTGYPTLDYFLSSDLMEPENGQDHYTENLVRLPNLSFRYDPIKRERAATIRAELGFSDSDILYWCCQSLFKYTPVNFDLFPRIAAEVSQARFVFLNHPMPAITQAFTQALQRAFAARGMDFSRHCLFLPRMEPKRFEAVSGVMDVFLDALGWSGCNTAIESFLQGVPAITHAGATMRARHAYAMLKMMDLDEAIAATADDYVSLATRIGKDAAWRRHLAEQTVQRRERLFYDDSVIAAFTDFVEGAAKN